MTLDISTLPDYALISNAPLKAAAAAFSAATQECEQRRKDDQEFTNTREAAFEQQAALVEQARAEKAPAPKKDLVREHDVAADKAKLEFEVSKKAAERARENLETAMTSWATNGSRNWPQRPRRLVRAGRRQSRPLLAPTRLSRASERSRARSAQHPVCRLPPSVLPR
jgi:hypothetical protein